VLAAATKRTCSMVVDYGSEGRRELGNRPVTLMRIPITANMRRFD